MKKVYSKVIVALLLLFLFMFTMDVSVMANSGFMPPKGHHIVSTKKTTLAPGVVESEIIYNTPDGSNPVSGFIVDINLGSSVNIMAASKDYNQAGTQTVRKMAEAAKQKNR